MLFGNLSYMPELPIGKPVIVRFGGSFDKFYGESTLNQQKMIEQALQIPDGLVVLSGVVEGSFFTICRSL